MLCLMQVIKCVDLCALR